MSVFMEDGKLRLSGYVGDYLFDDGFTSADIVMALAGIDDASDLTVHLNSGGGIATEGAAIHSLLSARKGKTDIVIEGIAASAASLIAMAGDTVIMSAGAVMMIHDPAGYTVGTSDEHSKAIEALEALANAYARVYAAKSGKTPAQCRAIMKEERWMTPEQAVKEGFADRAIDVQAKAVAAFDYRAYLHAPERLTALASTKNWSMVKKPADPVPDERGSMRDRVKAIMTSEEAKGRTELAEHLAYETETPAEAAIIILAKTGKVTTPDYPTMSDYEETRLGRAVGAGVKGPSGGSNGGGASMSSDPLMVSSMRKLLKSGG